MDGLPGKSIFSGVLLALVAFQAPASGLAASTNEPAAYKASLDYKVSLEQGKRYFKEGDYPRARTAFEQALRQHQASSAIPAALYYNLGSVNFKLKDYRASQAYFNRLTDHSKLAPLAWYNLALIENRQGHKAAAITRLNKSKALTNDPQLAALVDRQLQKLESADSPANDSQADEKQDWHAYLYAGHGYDSNINFVPLEVGSGESGQFFQGIGLFDKVISGKDSGGKQPVWLFTSSFFASNYYSTDFNDYSLLDVGLRYKFRHQRWRHTLDLNIKQSTYGHNNYQRQYAATFRTKRRFAGGDTLRLRYRYEQISSLESIYDYLEGNRHRLRAGYQFKWPRDSVYLWYELEFNNRRNTLRRNYSPTRNGLRLRYEKKIKASHKVYLEADYRRSDYASTPTQNRLDNRHGYTLAYVYDLADDWQLKARWRVQTNRSTDSVFTYDRHVGLLTLRKSF